MVWIKKCDDKCIGCSSCGRLFCESTGRSIGKNDEREVGEGAVKSIYRRLLTVCFYGYKMGEKKKISNVWQNFGMDADVCDEEQILHEVHIWLKMNAESQHEEYVRSLKCPWDEIVEIR